MSLLLSVSCNKYSHILKEVLEEYLDIIQEGIEQTVSFQMTYHQPLRPQNNKEIDFLLLAYSWGSNSLTKALLWLGCF